MHNFTEPDNFLFDSLFNKYKLIKKNVVELDLKNKEDNLYKFLFIDNKKNVTVNEKKRKLKNILTKKVDFKINERNQTFISTKLLLNTIEKEIEDLFIKNNLILHSINFKPNIIKGCIKNDYSTNNYDFSSIIQKESKLNPLDELFIDLCVCGKKVHEIINHACPGLHVDKTKVRCHCQYLNQCSDCFLKYCILKWKEDIMSFPLKFNCSIRCTKCNSLICAFSVIKQLIEVPVIDSIAIENQMEINELKKTIEYMKYENILLLSGNKHKIECLEDKIKDLNSRLDYFFHSLENPIIEKVEEPIIVAKTENNIDIPLYLLENQNVFTTNSNNNNFINNKETYNFLQSISDYNLNNNQSNSNVTLKPKSSYFKKKYKTEITNSRNNKCGVCKQEGHYAPKCNYRETVFTIILVDLFKDADETTKKIYSTFIVNASTEFRTDFFNIDNKERIYRIIKKIMFVDNQVEAIREYEKIRELFNISCIPKEKNGSLIYEIPSICCKYFSVFISECLSSSGMESKYLMREIK